ncbi:MAG: amino acid ABC transporter permease [Anaerotignum sp.]|nr:amino acid ABC transporter permease [Anaerotignum sp.]MBO5328930.1 amino acid ABC transporter permease [Anaerotignum sp.]MBP3629028.1 amino acid ABC transporter permease [Anaerotignum sp.]MBQ5589336.1 amino acid ABC transporter permease [Anaerotignum sp.]
MSGFFEYVGQCMPQLTMGLKLTLQMTILSLVLAVIVGMITCLFSISKVKPLNWISGIYLSLIRGTPLMVQAFFIYFGITGALGIRITSFSAAILVLCLNAGAYLSEIFRSGIAAVNKGQMEAARSLGLPYGVAMRKIILPQAIRIVIPSVLNQFIITLKDTSILSVIGCGELMRQGQLIVARNYESFKTYAIVAVMYYVVVVVLTKIFQLVERRLANK